MAKLIFTDNSIRPCVVKCKNALFHRWTTRKQVLEPSPMIGGHSGGQLEFTFGLIEYEDGTIEEVVPALIMFIDGRVENIFQKLQEDKQ